MANQPKSKQSATDARSANWIRVLRFAIIGLLTAIGCAAMVAYTAAHWVERQVLTTDNWVAMVAPLPQAPVVTTALAGYVTTQIFTNIPVEQEIKDALPPRAAFLASPLASQLQTLTNKITNQIIKSDNFETIWTAANRKAMDRLTNNARGNTKPLSAKVNQKFNLDLNDVKSKISDKLGSTSVALPSLDQHTGKAIAIATDLKETRQRIWSYVRSIDYLSAVLPFMMLAAFFGALAFSHRRRRLIIIITASSIVLLLLELISLKTAKQSVLGQVKVAANEPAVSYIFDALTLSLKNIINTWLIGWIVILVICILSGPAGWAVSLRRLVRLDRIKESTFFNYWYGFRAWVKESIYYIWVVIAGALLFWLAFSASINNRLLTNSVLFALALIALVYIIANPHSLYTKDSN
ncbi:MAG TPA: hypothetical protein VLG47_01475 [Candidatus Saccharimonadales bacterium]|nr:hypothetical protein [Candidatus Saccharimonadales bacterium]